MSTQHTPGRLRVPDDGTVGSIETEDGTPIGHTFQVSADDQRHGSPIRRANARRLVACWNACIDVSTEALERYHGNGGIEDATDEDKDAVLNELQAQRDQLLKALELCKGNISSLAAAHPKIYSEWLAVVSAAIAKATGGVEAARAGDV